MTTPKRQWWAVPLPPGRRTTILPLVAPDHEVECHNCGLMIQAGIRFVLIDGYLVTHEGGCPPPWYPDVIEGGARSVPAGTTLPPEQLRLWLLAAVDDAGDNPQPDGGT